MDMSSEGQTWSRRSFQAKNSKNLSLNIVAPSTMSKGVEARPVGLDSRFVRRPGLLMSRRSDAAIYIQRKDTKIINDESGEPLHPKVARSLSLSLNTTELAPSTPTSSDKQKWVLPRMTSFDEYTEESGLLLQDAYSNGPLCVVSPNLCLYSEPTLDEALQFDLVINVAAEVTDLGPLIPRESGVEYVRVPWTHNSKIGSELSNLTETIHLARQRGKKILIHCQCGISRSASLVVAYIMRYSKLSLNDAYERLKSVAHDISPNMGLVFQLMEWGEAICGEDDFLISSLSHETTPRTPNEYCKSSLSSASTCSSTTVVSER